MAIISNSEAVILGMLCADSKYAYEIEKIIEEQSMRDWTDIGFSSIYYVLKNLEKKKLVESILQNSEKNRTRKMYTITDSGKGALQEYVQDKISHSKQNKWDIDVCLAYLDILPKTDIIMYLNQYRKSLEELVQGYKNLQAYLTENECPINRMQLALRPIILYQAEITWVDSFLIQLQTEKYKITREPLF